MRRTIARIATAVAAAAAVSLAGAPAHAAPIADDPQGLSFYEWNDGGLGPEVAHFASVDGTCLTFPANAEALVGWSEVSNVDAWLTPDCTGNPWFLGTLRTFPAGKYGSFRAYPIS